MKYKILATEEFDDWLECETARSRVQIAKRIENVRDEGHFGDHKLLRIIFGSFDGKMVGASIIL